MPTTALITAPTVLATEPVHVAAIRLHIPRNGMAEQLPTALEELFRTLVAQGLTPAGPWFAHHIDLPTDHFHFDACVPVASPVQPTGRVEPRVIPAMTVARTLYRGPYTQLPQAWAEFRAWAIAQQLPTDAQVIERYLVNPSTTLDPDQLQTELVWPLFTAASDKTSPPPKH